LAREQINVAASIRAHLKNLAKEQQVSFQHLLTRFALERFLFRLSVSPYKHIFILKGAMLYAAWLPDPFRATRDIDLLSLENRGTEYLLDAIRTICAQPVIDDGLRFDTDDIRSNLFSVGKIDGTFRVRTSAQLGSANIPIQIDIGFGDSVTPEVQKINYPVLLNQPKPNLYAYPRETVIAEKFEAIVSLDLANSRMKDFYDLLAMLRLFNFDGATLVSAIQTTFEKRATSIPRETPPCLTSAFSKNSQTLNQWRSFLTRDGLLIDEPDLHTVIREIRDFIMPAALTAIDDRRNLGHWKSNRNWTLTS